MLEVFALICLFGALILLYALSVIDLREGLLPNEIVLGFFCLGVVFHMSTVFYYLSLNEMAIGALIGGGILYVIRLAAEFFYQDDALGLGDVKLLTAAGVWLGPFYILIALTLGALAGIAHGGLVILTKRVKTGIWMNPRYLSIPAGPGFALGIIVTGLIQFLGLHHWFMS